MREARRSTNLTQMASATYKIIFDAVSQWHPARSPRSNALDEVAPASAEENVDAFKGEIGSNHIDKSEFR